MPIKKIHADKKDANTSITMLQDVLEAIAESERLGEQPIPWESVVGELVYVK